MGHITDWDSELSPFYDQGRRMLGVVTNPTHTHSDTVIKEVARDMGAEDTFVYTPVGVFFGEKTGGRGKPGETVPDPFFGGVGPDRTACIECGECMTGCRHGAKNTLVKNYLGLAERAGARILDRTTVSDLRERGDGTWEVTLERTGAWTKRGKRPRTMTAAHVVVAAGTWGTQHLLHYAKDSGSLPRLSGALGRLTRTNSSRSWGRWAISTVRSVTSPRRLSPSFHPARHPSSHRTAGLQRHRRCRPCHRVGSCVPRWLLLYWRSWQLPGPDVQLPPVEPAR